MAVQLAVSKASSMVVLKDEMKAAVMVFSKAVEMVAWMAEMKAVLMASR